MATLAARPIALALFLATPLAAVNITVNSTADADSADADCSLREAIVAANTDAAYNGCLAGTGTSDRILFDLTFPATITIGSNLPGIHESVAIVGPGVDQLTIDGQDLYALLGFLDVVDVGPWFVVSGLTLTNGLANGDWTVGGALLADEGHLVLRDSELSSSSAIRGGGLGFTAIVTVERSRILGNTATTAGGGAGIYADSSSELTLVDSTVAGNVSTVGDGGGISASGASAVTIRSSTISGNDSFTSGGGVVIVQVASGFLTTATIESSTVVGNRCGVGNPANTICGGGVRVVAGLGGSLAATLTNTVIAENLDSEPTLVAHDLLLESDPGLTFTTLGFNLIGDNRGAASDFPASAPPTANANGDFAGDGTTPIDPYLGPLADHGGPTPTHGFVAPPLSAPHPLADQGGCPGAAADQRGYGNGTSKLRVVDLGPVVNNPSGDACDIGALEFGGAALVPSAIFADGFESGRLLFWSSDVP